jgi:hypothetical protein
MGFDGFNKHSVVYDDMCIYGVDNDDSRSRFLEGERYSADGGEREDGN